MVRDEMSVAEVPYCSTTWRCRVPRLEGGRPRRLGARVQEGDQQSSDDKYRNSSWESVRQMMRNNDSTYQQKQFDKLRIVHIRAGGVITGR